MLIATVETYLFKENKNLTTFSQKSEIWSMIFLIFYAIESRHKLLILKH